MGVSGLLQLLKSIHRPCHIKTFKGLTLGFDAYCWLHPAALPHAVALAQGRETTKYVEYVMHRIRMLQHYGITPYVVFDGNYLPSKSHTEEKRAESRAAARQKGLELLSLGRTQEAQQELQRAIDITPEMARNIITVLKTLNIKYVVAPYEADAQLAYLEREGLIDGIISEDSDLLVFGAKKLITKLDRYGECVEIRREELSSCRAVSFVGWTDEMFRRMAILTGCDYLPGLSKIGLKTAHSLIRRHKELERTLRALQFVGKVSVPPGYLQDFKNAEYTFLHQWVFCPKKKMLVMCTEWPEEQRPEDISFIGENLDVATANGIAKGDLHPMTKRPLVGQPKSFTDVKSAMRDFSQRSDVLSTPSDVKGHKKPIDSFFKPRRTPLAELDPNCFTPSPSQQDLLRRHSTSVLSTPVDENNFPRQSFAAPSISRSTGAVRPSRDRLGLPIGPNSVPHALKRPRLCDDSPPKDRTKTIKGLEASSCSKFFGSANTPEPSPSLNRQIRQKQRGDVDSVYRNGSLESTTLDLPDPSDTTPSSSLKLEVFQEVRSVPMTPNIEKDGMFSQSQSSLSSLSTTTSTLSDASTDATSFSFADSATMDERPLNRRASSSLEEVKSRFTFTAANSQTLAKPGSSSSTNRQLLHRESALRRLGRQAMQRSQSLSSLNVTKGAMMVPGDRVVKNDRPPCRTSRTESVLPVAKAECEPTAVVCQGSEDLIVPNSEEECSDGDQEDAPSATKVNFGRFVFDG